MVAAPALMAAPFLLGFGEPAGVVAFVIGAVLLGLALQTSGPGRAVPISAHAGFDYLLAVAEAALRGGLAVKGFASSGLPGPKGNRETFIWCGTSGEGIADPEAGGLEVEP